MWISGTQIAQQQLDLLATQILSLPRPPKLGILIVGSHPSSLSYVKKKRETSEKIGLHVDLISLPETVALSQVLEQVETWNQDPEIDGILIQLPLPPHLSSNLLFSRINPSKDVDGFHPENMGKLLLEDPSGFIPCTPLGIQKILASLQIPTSGQRLTIIGRSQIVGRPLAALMMQKGSHANATVTVLHSQSLYLEEQAREADILVAAVGIPRMITASMVKEGATVIDVGITRMNGKLVGDVDFDQVAPKCLHITPVPGGVGPMTVAMLAHNTVRSCRQRCAVP